MNAMSVLSKTPEIFGFIGSIALAIPSIRHANAQWKYKRYLDIPAHRPETQALDQGIMKQMEQRAQRAYYWDLWDSLSIFLGSACLALSFLASLFK